MNSNANPECSTHVQHFTDGSWVVHIWDTLSATEPDLENSHAVCICEVPESLSHGKKKAFIPQFVGLGPYHHFRADLIMTKEKKLAAAKRALKNLLPSDMNQFKQLISETESFGSDIQTFYHPDVNSKYNHHTLSYLLTVDGLFLLAFITLLNKPNHDPEFSTFLTGNLRMPLFNAVGVELTKSTLINEVFMLENQIPFYVLKQINGASGNETQSDDKDLVSKVERLCKQQCPFIELEKVPCNTVHLLDLMYHMIVPSPESQPVPQPDPSPQSQPVPQPDPDPEPLPEPEPEPEPSLCCNILVYLLVMCFIPAYIIFHIPEIFLPQPEAPSVPEPEPQPELGLEPQQEPQPEPLPVWCNILVCLMLICLLPGYIVCLILKLFLWVIISMFRKVKKVLSYLFRLIKMALRPRYLNLALSLLHDTLSSFEGPLPRALTQAVASITANLQSNEGVRRVVMIQSVEELHQAGILFQPAKSGISSIDFDNDECTFYLPSIKLDVNSEVIIRNLVAYETLIKSNTPLVFTRYVELMRAIIDTPADVKILVDNKIITSELSTEVITDLFNGMSKSIRPTMTPKLDNVIHKVKAKFDSTQKRKWYAIKHMSGTFFTAIGGLVFLVFIAVQTYCTVYSCSSTSKFGKLPDGGYGKNTSFISSM